MNYLNEIPKDRDIYMHLHVPKTAGTSMWKILEANFGGRLGADYALGGHPGKYSQAQMAEVLYQWDLDCFTAHNYSLPAIPFESLPNIHAFSFVRDPVAKAISSYFYLRNQSQLSPWHVCKKKKLTELLQENQGDIIGNLMLFDCSQVDFLMAGIADLNSVIEYSRNYNYHLLPTERFDDSLICLEKLYPAHFRDCSYGERSNTSPRDQKVTSEDLKLIERLPWIGKDRNLHKFSIAYLDELIESCFVSEDEFAAARTDFRKRCDEKSSTSLSGNMKADGKTSAMPMGRRLKSAARIILRGN